MELIPDQYVLEEFAISGAAVRYGADGEDATPFNGQSMSRGLSRNERTNERTNPVDWDYIQGAALRSVARWKRTGRAPRVQPRISMRGNKPDGLDRDDYGNVLGGIRVPELEAPIATHRGERGDMTNPAWLEGSIEPFSAEKVKELYPDGRNAQWQRAVDGLVSQGVLLEEDEAELRARVDGMADAAGA